MMSVNSSSAERKARRFPSFFTSQRRLAGMRLWPTALSALLFLLYHVALPIMLINSLHDEWHAREMWLTSFRGTIVHLFGQRGYAGVLVICVAMVFALQGFAYLMSRREVDFYESQPVSRSRRFVDISVNSFLIFLVTYVVSLLIGLLICAAAGGITSALMSEVLLQLFRCIALYLAVFAIGLLAVMLTGNVVVSILAAAVLLFYELAFRLALSLYQEHWFSIGLHDSTSLIRAKFSPIYHHFVRSEYGLQGIVMNLLIAVCVTALAYFCYSRRPNEAAGTAVPFRPVRVVVKIAVAVLGALCVGMLSVLMSTVAYTVVMIVLAAVIIACIMEIIYAFDFKAVLKHFPENAAAAVISLLIFFIFAFDLFGVRTWTPSPDAVKDCALLDDGYFTDHFYADGTAVTGRPSDYAARYMSLTDVDGVIDLVKACYAADSEEDSGSSYPMRVLYRLKNGNEITRSFYLPESIDRALVDKILGSAEYREGYFQIYHDEFVAAHIADGKMSYDNGTGRFDLDPADYEAFREAYKKDLEQFSYSFVQEHAVIGEISLSYYDDENGFSIDYQVYDAFDETIAFLREKDAVVSPLDQLGSVSRIVIYPAYANLSFGRREDGEIDLFDTSDLSHGVAFTDEDEIRAILEAAVPDISGPLYSWNSGQTRDYDYRIITFGKDGSPGHQGSGSRQTPNVEYVFRAGEVPEFVKQAFADLEGDGADDESAGAAASADDEPAAAAGSDADDEPAAAAGSDADDTSAAAAASNADDTSAAAAASNADDTSAAAADSELDDVLKEETESTVSSFAFA